jgi:uncharacterized protein YeaO (DUF488 family)
MARTGHTRTPHLRIRRVYEPAEPADGTRVLVDRVWPRGVAKADLPHDAWLRDVAPSPGLRTWFGHDPDRYGEFSERYRAELAGPEHAEALARLRAYAAAGPLTLLTSTRDLAHSHVRVLAEALGGGPPAMPGARD